MSEYGRSGNESIPFLSVIIPVYNVGPYIRETLGSLEKQTSRDFEVLIVNDGSTDDSMEYVRDFLSATTIMNIRVLDQKNGGVSRARNRGIEEARGRYLLFLDADDHIHETLVEKTFHVARSNGPDIVYFGFDKVRGNGRISQRYLKRNRFILGINKGETVLEAKLSGLTNFHINGIICKKEIVNAHSIVFTPGCTHGEDQEFLQKCFFHAGSVACIPETLSYYVRRESSATRQYTMKLFNSVGVCRRLELYFNRNDASERIREVMSSYVLPKRYIQTIFLLMKGNCDSSKILEISRHPRIRDAIRPFRMVSFSKRNIYLFKDKFFLLYFPWLTVNLCMFFNRTRRFLRGQRDDL